MEQETQTAGAKKASSGKLAGPQHTGKCPLQLHLPVSCPAFAQFRFRSRIPVLFSDASADLISTGSLQ